LTLTRAVRVAHEHFGGLSGFGSGEGDRSSLLRDREPADGAVPADDGHRWLATLCAYPVERIGAVIAADEQDPLPVGRPRGRHDVPGRSVQGLGQTDTLAAVRRLEIHEKIVTVLGNVHAGVSDRASIG